MSEDHTTEVLPKADLTSWPGPLLQLWHQWRLGQRPRLQDFLAQAGPLTPIQLGEVLRVDQQQRWQRGERILAEAYLEFLANGPADQEEILLLLHQEHQLREAAGESPALAEYLERFPQFEDQLRRQWLSTPSGNGRGRPTSAERTLLHSASSSWGDDGEAPPSPEPDTDVDFPEAPPLPTMIGPHQPCQGPAGSSGSSPVSEQSPIHLAETGTFLTAGKPAHAEQRMSREKKPAQLPRSGTMPLPSANPACAPVDDESPTKFLMPGGPPERLPPGMSFLAPTTAAAASNWPVLADFEIVEELGQGGMGVVYKARQRSIPRTVALKMIQLAAMGDPNVRIRFYAEADAVAQLLHPNIVQIYERSEEADRPYFALEFVDGDNLDKKIGGTPLPHRQAAELVEILSRAMHAAHLRGVVHRDLKPANVLLTAAGNIPKITDFGLAKRLDLEPDGRTHPDQVMGTPSYMAPEQAMGQSALIGPATDIYALGAILYETLTGRPPFRGATLHSTIEQVKSSEPVPPSRLQPRLPRDLETICLKCLQKQQRHRYPSALDLAEDLHSFLAGEPIKARPTPRWERVWKWVQRRPSDAALIVVIVAASLFILGLIVRYNAEMKHQLEENNAKLKIELDQAHRAEVQSLFKEATEASRAGNHEAAHVKAKTAKDKVQQWQELADLHEQADQVLQPIQVLLDDQEGKKKAKAQLELFRLSYRDALFHLTQVNGQAAAVNQKKTREAAWKALNQFGLTPDAATTLALDNQHFTPDERAETKEGCCELLLILAEIETRLPPQARHEAIREGAGAGLRLLARAEQLGIRTRTLHQRKARCLKLQGAANEARQEQALAEQMEPILPLDFFMRGLELYEQKHLNQAIADFNRTIELQSGRHLDPFWPHYFLAVCYLKLPHPDPGRAKDNLISCRNEQPHFPWVYVLLGNAECQLKKFEEAEADFGKALEHGADDRMLRLSVHVSRGVLLIQQKKYADAAVDLEKAIELGPDQYQAYVNLAKAYEESGDLGKAIQQFDRAIQKKLPDLAALYRGRAHLYARKRDYNAVVMDYGNAIQHESKDSPFLAEDYFQLGQVLFQAERYQEAVDAYQKALNIQPDNAALHFRKAQSQMKLKHYAEAVKEFDTSWSLEPIPRADFFRNRALAQTQLGNYQAAIGDYTKALKIKDDDSHTYSGRGWAYAAQGSYPEALEDFERAVKLEDTNAYAVAGRGYAYVKGPLRLYHEAVEDAKRAVALAPNARGILHNAARIYALAGAKFIDDADRQRIQHGDKCKEKAVDLLDKIIKLTPSKDRDEYWKNYLGSDPDLKPLHDTRGYKRLKDERTQRSR